MQGIVRSTGEFNEKTMDDWIRRIPIVNILANGNQSR